ncbi:hypothetical protein BOTBODRAFT_29253 [Botryobasidium botryosum FD-172 SS1]|uniref:AMP-dependent synthetase/ligase domain-containing protein n=1 Tax=Botryobasidium botryosum (strain FD-172 SS1) TaxID=930990 RepID=A0A067MQC9_BOTB1|nr:hypothetical protein BOTBODRAFT_29253 [Botryobasidium botryosum FD-172 SS1]
MSETSLWKPARSIPECNAILTGPGTPFEIETALVGDRVQRVFKHAPPSMRALWLNSISMYGSKTYIQFESERLSFSDVHSRACRAASVFREVYGVRKGDRVAIVMRNYPEWIIIFWAAHLLGAVVVCVNAWLPAKVLHYCIAHTNSKVVVFDCDRAEVIYRGVEDLKREAGANAVLVVRAHESNRKTWNGMQSWEEVMKRYEGKGDMAWKKEPECLPEDNCSIFFTSGTTGLPKGALSTQRAVMMALFNNLVGYPRAFLRAGQPIPVVDPSAPSKIGLISIPLFHVTACLSSLLPNTATGGHMILMRKWDVKEAVRLIVSEKVTHAGGVPSVVLDLLETTLKSTPNSLESFGFGGAPPPAQLTNISRKAFPNVQLMQGYGMTETNSGVATIFGPDYVHRPTSTGYIFPTNDVLIMDPKRLAALPAGQIGEIWLRGSNLMKEYWRNPEATAQAITRDGWLRTGDLGFLDEEGFLYLRDRVKDIIIRGGENVDSTTVEQALLDDPRIMECAAVGVPDKRLGELVAAIAVPRSAWTGGKVKEAELIEIANKSLPGFAVPVMVIVQDEPLDRNPGGKVLKKEYRALAKKEWERRGGGEKAKAKAKAKL